MRRGCEHPNAAGFQTLSARLQVRPSLSVERNIDPADARRAFQFHGLTVRSPSSNPVAPNASAERAMVPRLPGSCSPAAMTTSAGAGRNTSLRANWLNFHQRGHALRRFGRNGAGENIIGQQASVSVCAESCGSSLWARAQRRLAEEHSLSLQAERIASSSRCMPSTATAPDRWAWHHERPGAGFSRAHSGGSQRAADDLRIVAGRA